MKKGFGFGQVLDRVLDRCPKHQIVQLPNTGLYSSNKGNSYALLDFDSLRKDNTRLQVFTNNQRIMDRYKIPHDVSSDRKNANVKFRISKYLTAVMLALPISRGMITKYFNRLH